MELIVTVALVLAMLLAIIELVRTRGQALLAWSAAVGFAALVYARLA